MMNIEGGQKDALLRRSNIEKKILLKSAQEMESLRRNQKERKIKKCGIVKYHTRQIRLNQNGALLADILVPTNVLGKIKVLHKGIAMQCHKCYGNHSLKNCRNIETLFYGDFYRGAASLTI